MEYARGRIQGAGGRISQVDPVHPHKMQTAARLGTELYIHHQHTP